jgi:hypothetical protein
MKPRNTCDPDDHLASIRRMNFRSLQEETGLEPPQKKNTMDMGNIFCFFLCCIVGKTFRSSSTLPSVFLPDNTEPYPLTTKLHPSLLLNKYPPSFQTKPQGHM